MLGLYLCKQTKNISMSVELDASLWKSPSGVEFLLIFTFFINALMKTLIKSIIYCQTMLLDRLLYITDRLTVNLSKSGNALF